jgi:Skp family chaperone for outer membrane proteins
VSNNNHSSSIVTTIIVSLIFIAAYAVMNQLFFMPRIAYVNTGKLMIGFSESAKVEKEIKVEDDQWQGQLKQLQDSLQGTINNMSKEYNSATPAKKKEMQDMLSARNQQVNNFKQANMRRIDDLRQKKMQGVFDKVNVYLGEYGKKHRYGIILGTVAGGSILYGNEAKYDITDDVVKGLNERYK